MCNKIQLGCLWYNCTKTPNFFLSFRPIIEYYSNRSRYFSCHGIEIYFVFEWKFYFIGKQLRKNPYPPQSKNVRQCFFFFAYKIPALTSWTNSSHLSLLGVSKTNLSIWIIGLGRKETKNVLFPLCRIVG